MIVSGRCHGPGCQQADCVVCKVYRLMESLPPAPDREPIKLTREQRAFLMAMYSDPRPSYLRGGALGDFAGTPIELVDDEADSFFASRGATYPLVAPVDLQVAQSGMWGWLGRWIHRKRRTR